MALKAIVFSPEGLNVNYDGQSKEIPFEILNYKMRDRVQKQKMQELASQGAVLFRVVEE